MNSLIVSLIFLLFCLEIEASAYNKQSFCQKDTCLTCVGRYCTTTCVGENCKECPTGECCDGVSCNICRGEKCCSTPKCNSCIKECLEKCRGQSTCHYNCFQECLPGEEGGDEQSGRPASNNKLIVNKNYLPVNVTTTINITNTIRNENSIHNPIFINTTNINNQTGYRNYHKNKVIIANRKIYNNETVVPETPKYNCCEVIHPQRCQKVRSQNQLLCYTRKHNECSSLCTSQHIHIIQDEKERHNCITIAEQPYWYCGHYRAENCDGCYNSNSDDIDEIEVSSNNCSEECNSTRILEEFYNKPYILPYSE